MRNLVFPYTRLGWWFLMEIGLGPFLDKFEEYFGRFCTRVLLGLVGLALSTFCARIVWISAIKPLVMLLPIKGGAIAPVESLWMGLALAVGAGIGTAFMAAFLNWRLAKRIERLEHKLQEVEDLAMLAVLTPH